MGEVTHSFLAGCGEVVATRESDWGVRISISLSQLGHRLAIIHARHLMWTSQGNGFILCLTKILPDWTFPLAF